jgi:hypothetical protein
MIDFRMIGNMKSVVGSRWPVAGFDLPQTLRFSINNYFRDANKGKAGEANRPPTTDYRPLTIRFYQALDRGR